jgi:hypothetical protein
MTRPTVSLAAEGSLDFAVLRRLIASAGLRPGDEYGNRGKSYIDQRLARWNLAAQWQPWVVLRDLDRDAGCAPQLLSKLIGERSAGLCLRIAVHEVEAWLLADREGFSRHFLVPRAKVPLRPESLLDAKATLLELIDRSKRKDRTRVVVRARSGEREAGPEYNAVLADFVSQHWQPTQAAEASDSLARTLRRLGWMAKDWATI